MAFIEEIDRHRPRRGIDEGARFRYPKHFQANPSKPAPQAVVKVVSQARGHRVRGVMEYIAREGIEGEELALERESGETVKGKEAIAEVHAEWKEDFERAKPGSKRPPRHATHMILSAKASDRDAHKVLAAARATLHEQLHTRGYDYVFVLHQDTNNPHVHVVINNYHREGGPKLRLNPPELQELREQFAAQMRSLGIEQVASQRRDRVETLEKISKGLEGLKLKRTWYQQKMRNAAPSVDVYAHRRAVARTVAQLRREIKTATLPLSADRKELMGDLRSLSQALLQPGEPTKEVQAVVRKLGKDAGLVGRYLDELQRPPKVQAPTLTATQKLQRRKTLERMAERIQKNIDQARTEIRKAPLSWREKRQQLAVLKQHERTVSRARGLGR